MKKVLYINNFEAPYRVPFYNLLGEHYDLTIAFSETQDEQKGRDKKWFSNEKRNYKIIQLNGKNIFGKRVCFDVKKMLKDYDLVFMDMYGSPTNIYAMHCLKRSGVPFVLSVDGMLDRSNEKALSVMLKRFCLNAPHIVMSPGESVDKCILSYGVDPSKLRRYHFTSLTSADIEKARIMTENNKQALREKLGVCEKKMLLSIGQFIHRKGFDVLLKAMENLSNDIGVYIVGGEPTEEYIRIKESLNLKNVHFVGFKIKDELAEYYAAADAFVLPTREDIWGLVINEAMAYSLPVITTDRCVAGLSLVKKNGYIVPVDNVGELAEKIALLLFDDFAMVEYRKNSFETIRYYTVETMAAEHIEIFDSILEK